MNPLNTKALIEQKLQDKLSMQATLNWPKEQKRPLICIPTGMTDTLGGKLMADVLPGILSLQTELL